MISRLLVRQVLRFSTRVPYSMRLSTMTLEKPTHDSREYKQVCLQNGIVATLVSDVTLTRSSCALAVNVGASADPYTLPGLAHFTEHMLFLGTEKYPVENYYKDFLNQNGGSSNASTSMEATVYKFDINSAHFSTSLDIFSQFFKKPLLTACSAGREIKAVDAEDSKNRIVDARRTLQILKCLIHPSSSYSKYSTGNIHTLANGDAEANSEQVREAMMQFYERWYRSEKMGVAVVGPQSLEELQYLVTASFSDINHQTLPQDPSSVEMVKVSGNSDQPTVDSTGRPSAPYPFLRGGVAVYINPVKEINRVDILWGMPPTRPLYRANPCRLLGHLLGHEGVGSPFAYLQRRGWVTGLSAGTRTSFIDFSIFQVSLSVTPEGLEHWQDAIAVVYAHIELVKQMGDEDILRTWRETKACDDLEFMYQMKQSAREKAASLAEDALYCAPEHVLSYGYIRDKHIDISTVRQFLSRLVPGEEVCIVTSKKYSWISSDDTPHGTTPASEYCDAAARWGETANCVEPRYGVHYYEQRISERDIRMWKNPHALLMSAALKLPQENVYIPFALLDINTPQTQEATLVTERANLDKLLRNFPVCLMGSDNDLSGKCWWSEDLIYGHPRTSIFALLGPKIPPEPTCSASQLNSLARKVFAQITASERYPSTVAGLHNQVVWTYRGLEVRCTGYSPKLSVLVRDVLNDTRRFLESSNGDITAVLDNVKEKHIRALRSWRNSRPDSICADALTVLLQDHTWFPHDQLDAVTSVDVNAVKQATARMLQQADTLTYYSHGDLSREASCELFSEISGLIPVSCEQQPTLDSLARPIHRARQLPQGQEVCFLLSSFNKRDANSALICHFQAGDLVSTATTDALLMVLNRLLKEPLFTELRTRQQLGYIVSLSQDSHGRGYGNRIGGLTVNILSKRFHPLYTKDALGTFLSTQRDFIASISESELRSRVRSIISNLRELPTTYSTEASRNWGKIIDNYPKDYKLQVIDALEHMTLDSVILAADNWIFSADTRRCAIVMMCAESHEEDLKTAWTACCNSSCSDGGNNFWGASSWTMNDTSIFNELNDVKIARDKLTYPLTCV